MLADLPCSFPVSSFLYHKWPKFVPAFFGDWSFLIFLWLHLPYTVSRRTGRKLSAAALLMLRGEGEAVPACLASFTPVCTSQRGVCLFHNSLMLLTYLQLEYTVSPTSFCQELLPNQFFLILHLCKWLLLPMLHLYVLNFILFSSDLSSFVYAQRSPSAFAVRPSFVSGVSPTILNQISSAEPKKDTCRIPFNV